MQPLPFKTNYYNYFAKVFKIIKILKLLFAKNILPYEFGEISVEFVHVIWSLANNSLKHIEQMCRGYRGKKQESIHCLIYFTIIVIRFIVIHCSIIN